MLDPRMTRRAFLETSAVAAGALVFPFEWKSASPNDRLNVACVGVGGRGRAAVDAMAGENVVALCDVDDEMAKGAFEAVPDAKRFRDWRRMFEEMSDGIDAVTVSTPDHMHFAIAIAAIKAGKHVLVEKPLTHSVAEARVLTRAAREAGVATQMGNQGHANEGTRRIVEIVRSGVLGEIREVYHWTDRPIWGQGMDAPDHSDCIPVCPKSLDWDGWLGVAASRAYDPSYCPFSWRGWWDFGTGALGDMGCHIMDAAYWALELGAPSSIEAVSTPVKDVAAPKTSFVVFRYPARGDRAAVTVRWYDGGLRPTIPITLPDDWQWKGNGTLIVGENAMILADTYATEMRILPEARANELEAALPAPSIPRVEGGPFAEWIRACKGGKPAGSNFEYAGPFTEAVLLGNVAIRSQRRIEWDAAAGRVTNYEPANRFLEDTYRDGWGV